MIRLVVAAALVLAVCGRAAEAGWGCMTDDEGSIRAVEAYARSAKAAAPDWLCLDDPAKARAVAPRIAKACAKILDRRDPLARDCVELAAFAGLTAAGDHDVFALVAARPENPFDFPGGFWWPRLPFFAAMGDARGASVIRAEWQAALAKVAAKRSENAVTSWVMWRRDACTALAAIGGTDDLAFLEQQAAAPAGAKPQVVKGACSGAIATLKKRVGQI